MTTIDTLPDTTRVWIYQANQPFREADRPLVKMNIQQFVTSWVSHNRQLRAYGDLLYGQFIVLMVDESQADASGCSIDKSVYFLKQLQSEYGLDLFDRMIFTYKDGEEVKTANREAFRELYANGEINDSTPVFDNLVNIKRDFDQSWIKPLGESWHKRMV
jgi:hypothetical protein